jgi:membrane-associated phospholipid phosphatase
MVRLLAARRPGPPRYETERNMTKTKHWTDLAQIRREIDSVDVAIYHAIATTPTPIADDNLRRLSQLADRSKLWLSIASALAVVPGRSRRAALLGAASIGVASLSVNAIVKVLLRRSRPTATDVPLARQVRMPESTSFPSGHAASAFAFASAVGTELPRLSLPLQLLATTVAYSRVHTGVHYPSDVIFGGAVGSASAAVTAGAARYLDRARRTA